MKEALDAIGAAGMTVNRIYGYGLRSGIKKVYCGTECAISPVPKAKFKTAVCIVTIEKVLGTSQRMFETAQSGDGKYLYLQC